MIHLRFGNGGRARWLLVLSVFLSVIQLAAQTTVPSLPRPKILTTFLPAYCVLANIVGNTADVTNLLPAHVDPHEYQLSSGDLRKITQADLIAVNGLGLENWLSKALRAGGASTGKVIELSRGISPSLFLEGAGHNHDHGDTPHHHAPNPHIWLDPRLLMGSVSNVTSVLAAAYPVLASSFQSNALGYVDRLRALDAELVQRLAAITNVAFIVQHDAFPYFARRYSLKVVGILEQNPGSSPSPKYLSALLKQCREQKVRAVFTETPEGSKLARQLAKDLGIPTAQLETLETGPLTPAAYEEGMRRNAATLLQFLKP